MDTVGTSADGALGGKTPLARCPAWRAWTWANLGADGDAMNLGRCPANATGPGADPPSYHPYYDRYSHNHSHYHVPYHCHEWLLL